MDFVNVRAFVFVEGYGGDTSEKFLEIVLELLGVRSHRENLEEIVHGTEVESGEESTLTIEISIKLLLAMLEFRLESTELRGKNIVGAANDNVRAFVSTLHNLLPGFVDFTESGCVLRQGLSNISFSEDSDKGLPETLNLKPFLNGFRNRGKESNLLKDFVLEGSNVSHNSHLIEVVNVIFNFLLNISNISTNYGGNTVNGINLEFTSIIMGNDFVSELLLKLELLVGVISDIFNLFFDLKKVGVEELLKDESLLIEGDLDSSKLDDFFPMAVTDRVLSKTLNDGEDFNHIINFVLKVSVGKPLLKLSRESHAISLEVLNDFNHLSAIFLYTEERQLVPESEGGLSFLVETIEFIKQVNFVFSFNKLSILLMRESEKRFSRVSGIVLLLDNFELVTFSLESF